jgi:putative SOS response-associated peptidase YedK
MCGRYVVAYDPETLVSGFSVVRVVPFPKRWNITPQSAVPVVHETREGERVATLMRWGLVPHWAKDTSIGNKLNNARSDGVFDKPSFRQAVRRRRCILPASGYYEWQPGPNAKSPKQPWYFSARSGQPLAMAGLFEAWRPNEDAEWLLSCCVITTEANALMAPIHDRMPVLLPPEQWARWLSRSEQDPSVLAPLLVPSPPDVMQGWPVGRAVSNSRSEGEGLNQPMTLEPPDAG